MTLHGLALVDMALARDLARIEVWRFGEQENAFDAPVEPMEALSPVRSSASCGYLMHPSTTGSSPETTARDSDSSSQALQDPYTDGLSKASIGAERCRTKTHSAIALVRSSASLSGIERNGEWLLSR